MGIARKTGAVALIALALTAAPASAARLPTAGKLERDANRFLASHGAARASSTGGASPGSPAAGLPATRVVTFYGAPQMGATVLGSLSPRAAAARLRRQMTPYSKLGDRPVLGEFDLVSVFATAGGGPDHLYRTRQDPGVIEIYLDQARAAGMRLMLDIQPGRSTFVRELRVLRPWLAEPDVDLALDPEWNVGRHGIPGRTEGGVSAADVNRVKTALARIVRENSLPAKLLVVHQFRRGSVRDRRSITQGDDVQTILNFDGIGSPRAKESGYAALSAPRLFNGFSLFYRRDRPLMKPASVLALDPEPDFLLYQ